MSKSPQPSSQMACLSKMEAGKLFHSPGQMPLEAADRLADPVSQIHAIKSLATVAWRLTKVSSDQAPLAMGGFATCLVTVSFAMMHFRDVTVQTLNIGNLCFVASIGLLISAQWEMVRGNTFSYTVLSAYGMWACNLPCHD